MELVDLITNFRLYTKDKKIPYFWTDDEITFFLNEGERESCIRGLLLFDKTTDEVCNMDVVAGTNALSISKFILEIKYAKLVSVSTGSEIELEILSREDLETLYPNWRTSTKEAYVLVHDDSSVEIIGTVSEDYTLQMEVFRLPLEDMGTSDNDEPEIANVHHRYIVLWAMHRAYHVTDSDAHAAELSDRYKLEFEGYLWKPLRAKTRIRRNANKNQYDSVFV